MIISDSRSGPPGRASRLSGCGGQALFVGEKKGTRGPAEAAFGRGGARGSNAETDSE
jgi:hypothetical protein